MELTSYFSGLETYTTLRNKASKASPVLFLLDLDAFLVILFFWRSSKNCSFPHSWIWYQVSHSLSLHQRLLHRAYLILQLPQPPPSLRSPKAPPSLPPPACTRWDPSAGGTQTNTTCPFLQVDTLFLPRVELRYTILVDWPFFFVRSDN